MTKESEKELELQGDQRQPVMPRHGGLNITKDVVISNIKRIINIDGLEGARREYSIVKASRKFRKKYFKRQRPGLYLILHVDQLILENAPTFINFGTYNEIQIGEINNTNLREK